MSSHGGKNSIFRLSIYNILVIQNPKKDHDLK